jgi:hypothetical protein
MVNPIQTHGQRLRCFRVSHMAEPFKVIVLVITAFIIWRGLKLIPSILTSLAWVVRRH